MSESLKNAAAPVVSANPTETSPQDATAAVENDHGEVAQLVEQLIRAKRLTYGQYQTLSKLVLADGTVDEEERRQINRLFDAIQAGAIRIEKK